ncbi:MAG: hypothetical protein ACK5C4_15415, partial [Pseudanabaena sp.]
CWKHQNRFFESLPKAGFQKTDFYNENCCLLGFYVLSKTCGILAKYVMVKSMKPNFHLLVFLSLAIMPSAALAEPVTIKTTPANTNYYPWIVQLSQSPIDWFASDVNAKVQGKAYRVVILLEDIYNRVFIEQVTFGTEGCCKKVTNARMVDLKTFVAKFGFTGEINGFRFMRWISPTSFIFRYKDRLFVMTAIDSPEVKVEPYTDD